MVCSCMYFPFCSARIIVPVYWRVGRHDFVPEQSPFIAVDMQRDPCINGLKKTIISLRQEERGAIIGFRHAERGNKEYNHSDNFNARNGSMYH